MAENETTRTDAALDFSGRTVAFAGRLASLSRRIAARAVEARGGMPRLALTRRTDILAVGHGSYGLLERGRLQHLLDRAGRFGAACVSENALLRALELLPDPRHEQRTIAIEDIAALSRLEQSAVRALVLFDVIEPWQGRCAFRDLITARTVFRLLQDQLSLPTVIAALLKLRRRTGAGTTPTPIPNSRARWPQQRGHRYRRRPRRAERAAPPALVGVCQSISRGDSTKARKRPRTVATGGKRRGSTDAASI